MNIFKKVLIAFTTLTTFISCQSDDIDFQNLADYLDSKENSTENVIAWAGSSNNAEFILVCFYPKPNTSNYRLYLANSTEITKEDTQNYTFKTNYYQPYTGKTFQYFRIDLPQEEVWAMVTFEEDNKISHSKPIRFKHQSSPTIITGFDRNISYTYSDNGFPIFSWKDVHGQDGSENSIFYQAIYNYEIKLVSGTFTLDTYYEHLDNENVVSSVIPHEEAMLHKSSTLEHLTGTFDHQFEVVGISEDNWANFLSRIFFVY